MYDTPITAINIINTHTHIIPTHTPPAGGGENNSIHDYSKPEELVAEIIALNHMISQATDETEVELVPKKEICTAITRGNAIKPRQTGQNGT